MRVTCTSDFHGYLPEIEPTDLLLIGGDICPVWNHDLLYQESWLRKEFTNWLEVVPAKRIVGIGGNHDFIFRDNPKIGYELPWTYLHNEAVVIPGDPPLKIWGSPYSNKFGSWAFMRTEGDLAILWETIPTDIDILITHGPAYGFGDTVQHWSYSAEKRGWNHSEHVGSTSLTNRLTYDVWPNLKLHVTGHIHEGYGEYSFKTFKIINGAHVNDVYKAENPPIIIDL